jgi:hypothetical protein
LAPPPRAQVFALPVEQVLIEAAQARWHEVNAPELVVLVRNGRTVADPPHDHQTFW